MAKPFSIRKPRLTVNKKGVRIASPSVRIGKSAGVNISKRGVSGSLRTRHGSISTNRGGSCPLFALVALGLPALIGWGVWHLFA